MRYKVLLTVCLLLPCIFVFAQAGNKAARYYNKAIAYDAAHEREKACTEMQRAIKADPKYAEAYSELGAWHYQLHQYRQAADVFRNASKNCRNGSKVFAKPFARSLLANANADSALFILQSNTPSKPNKEWRQMEQQANFIKQALNSAWPDTAFNMGPRINTSDPELFPSISADSQTFYFTRKVNGSDNDFYYAVPDSCGGWFTARNTGSPLNTTDQELAQVISADRHYLFFTRCGNRSENGWEQGGCDLFMAYRANEDSAWSVPQSFGATINTPAYEGMACLSPDNRALYFVSDRDGGYGGLDIWVSRFDEGRWQKPVNLGASINTAGNEMAPFVASDNSTLYFSSDGHVGMGGSDLYISKRKNDSVWTTPVDMGYPVNSTSDEQSISVTSDGQKIYFASDRDSVAGNFDIYEMALPKPLQPQLVNTFEGYVYDSLSKERLNYASMFVMNGNDTLYHYQTNRGDGSYMMILPVGGHYTCTVQRISYTDVNDTLPDSSSYVHHSITHTITMLPQNYVKPVHDSTIAIIHFPLNSASLSDSDNAVIQKAIAPWVQEQGIIIFINGYTDNTGSPIVNEQLSYQRAGLVSTAIQATGMPEISIQSKGWGEANPIAVNDTEEGRTQNRRVEVIIRR